MLIAIVLFISAAALVASLAYRVISASASPRTKRSGSALADRTQWLTRNPGEATSADIETELSCHGLSASDVRLLTSRARALGMKPLTMWMSIQAYGARNVAVAVAGDLRHESLLEHLTAGTAPDFGELEVFAALNGLEAAADTAGRVRSGAGRTPAAMDRSQVIKRQALADLVADLDIYEPGTWPAGPHAA